jgi:hypothetical protein
MNSIKKCFAPLLTGVMLISLSSCGGLDTTQDNRSSDATQGQTATESNSSASLSPSTETQSPVASQSLKADDNKATTQNTTTLNIYHADSQCETLVSEKVAVPADNSVETAIGKVLEHRSTSDFSLAGYRVNVNSSTGVATVDFRRSPNSQRQFVSLSSCEQFALFGSLRKTLMENGQLKIKEVHFTEQGEEIYL